MALTPECVPTAQDGLRCALQASTAQHHTGCRATVLCHLGLQLLSCTDAQCVMRGRRGTDGCPCLDI